MIHDSSALIHELQNIVPLDFRWNHHTEPISNLDRYKQIFLRYVHFHLLIHIDMTLQLNFSKICHKVFHFCKIHRKIILLLDAVISGSSVEGKTHGANDSNSAAHIIVSAWGAMCLIPDSVTRYNSSCLLSLQKNSVPLDLRTFFQIFG